MLAKISKHNRSTNKKKKKREKCVCTLLVSESPDGDAALDHHAEKCTRRRGQMVRRVCGVRGEVVCGNRLYTVVAVVEGRGWGGQSVWALTLS